MMMRCDRFFIAELQEAGYDLDYNKLRDIYKRSRTKNFAEIQTNKMKHRAKESAVWKTAIEVLEHLED